MKFRNPFKNASITPGVSSESYIKQEAKRGDLNYRVSRSDLCEIVLCPARWRAGYREEETESTRWGTQLDALLFMPERYNEKFAVTPESYPAPEKHAKVKSGEIKAGDLLPWNANAGICEAWASEQGDKQIVSSKLYRLVATAARRICSDPELSRLVGLGQSQVLVQADYEYNGTIIPVKGLIDLVPEKSDAAGGAMLLDLKSTANAESSSWERSIGNFGYHVQAALYLDLYEAATKEGRESFAHIVQENFEPFHFEKRVLSQDWIELGRATYLDALELYAQCLATNEWPGYSSRLSFQGWQITEGSEWAQKRFCPRARENEQPQPTRIHDAN